MEAKRNWLYLVKNEVQLFCASFCNPKLNLAITPGISWLPTFTFQFPVMKRTSFLILVQKGLLGLHRTVQLQLLWHWWSKHRGLPDSFIHGIFQASILEWVAISFYKGAYQLGDRTQVSHFAGKQFILWERSNKISVCRSTDLTVKRSSMPAMLAILIKWFQSHMHCARLRRK